MFQRFKEYFISNIVNRPKLSLGIGFLLFIILSYGTLSIRSNFTPRIWFDPDSPQIQALDAFEKRFGGDQILAIGYYSKKKILSPKILEELQKLTEEMWLMPSVIRVDSITNFNTITAVGDDIEISPLVDDSKDFDTIIKDIKSLDELKDNLISRDYNFVLFFAKLKPVFDKTIDYSPVMDAYEKLKIKYQSEDNRFTALGNVSVTYAFKEISKTDNLRTIPLMFLLIFIILVITYRSFVGVMAPLFISGLTIVSTFGVLGHISYQFNSILAAIPGILIAICLADTIHILSSFYNQFELGVNKKDSIRWALEKNFLATILTTITTSVSFITISFTELTPIHDLGILSSIGTFLAWLFTFLMLPSLILLSPNKLILRKYSQRKKKATSDTFSRFIWRFKTPIILIFTVISISSFVLALDNEVNSDPIAYFDKNTNIKKDYLLVKEYFPGVRGIEIVIDSGSVGGVKNVDFLQRVDSLTKKLKADPEITQVSSIIDILKQVNFKLNNEDEKFNSLPDSKEKVAESLILYTMGLPPNQGLENIVSMDQRFLKMKLNWTMEHTIESLAKDKAIHDAAKSLNLNTKTGGFFPIYAQVNDKVVDSFFRSMTMAVILVSLIILFVFKDLYLSLLSMLPNILPLFFGAAYMAVNGIYIDIGTSIVAAICLGIAVDDTIHFVTHYVQNKKQLGSTAKALDLTFHSTGKALILTTSLLVVGFGSFVMADFLPNHYFGILCAIVLTFALLTDLLFLPALLAVADGKIKK